MEWRDIVGILSAGLAVLSLFVDRLSIRIRVAFTILLIIFALSMLFWNRLPISIRSASWIFFSLYVLLIFLENKLSIWERILKVVEEIEGKLCRHFAVKLNNNHLKDIYVDRLVKAVLKGEEIPCGRKIT